MNDAKIKAFTMAQEAAQLDFSSALQGLMAGHESALENMRAKMAAKDMAFLMALALTEKGKRIDRDGIMAAKICEGLEGVSLCATEKKFLATHST